MNASEVKAVVNAAFQGVRLGGGMSLRQGEKADNFGEPPFTDRAAYRDADVTDDWTAISIETLNHFPYLAFMDPEGFRYYIPAFMLSIIDNYDSAEMRVIMTLSTLKPKPDDLSSGRDISWQYHMKQYSLLSRDQRRATAHYLEALPALVGLSRRDQKDTAQALKNYWQEFL